MGMPSSIPSEVVLLCHQTKPISANFLIFATGHRAGVPPNIFGAYQYETSEIVGHAMVGIATVPSDTFIFKDGTEKCSQSIVGLSAVKKRKWIPTELRKQLQLQEQPAMLALTNCSGGYLTVAIGCNGRTIRDWIDNVEQQQQQEDEQQENERQEDERQENEQQEDEQQEDEQQKDKRQEEERQKENKAILLSLLNDGLRRIRKDVAFACSIVMEWIHEIGIINIHEWRGDFIGGSVPEIKYDGRQFSLHNATDERPMFRVKICVEYDPNFFLGSKGVQWEGKLWHIKCIEAVAQEFRIDNDHFRKDLVFEELRLWSPSLPRLLPYYYYDKINCVYSPQASHCVFPFVLITPEFMDKLFATSTVPPFQNKKYMKVEYCHGQY
jgi:uncharacterized FlaG/YvyC family protein